MNMTDYEFEELPSGGSFAKWETVGDEVVGRIAAFGIDSGTDFNGDPCPQLVVETEGGNVTINGGQAALRRLMTDYQGRLGQIGHGARVKYTGTYQTKQGTEGKEFGVWVTPQPVAPVVGAQEQGVEAPF